MTQRRPISATLMRLVLLLVFALAAMPSSTPSVALAATNTLKLSVVSAADGNVSVGDFKYIINIDNTGTTTQRSPAPGTGCSPQDSGYPNSCNWVSIAGVKSSAPIYTQGNQDDFPGGVFTINNSPVSLPTGRYLISVLADGYKIDGAHFTVPGSGNVTVQMQPYDLPDATVRAFVFKDVAPTNSAPDAPAEPGLAGFEGHIKDYIDEVTTDVYGNPLCTKYQGEDPITFELTGPPVPIPGSGGHCLSDSTGMLAIPHLGPNRYALSVVPPNGSGWVQTTTLEGNHDWDAWVMEGSTGYDTEFVVAGEPFPATFFGFVKPANTMAAGNGTIKGKALAVSAYIPPVGGITGEAGLLGAKPKDKNPIKVLYVSLSDLNNNDQTVYTGRFTCDAACGPIDFTIPHVPDGDYVLGLWDDPQDYIFNEQNVSVRNGEVVDIGSISMVGWWTTIEGHVFRDLNENGKMDPGEPGIPNFPIVMRTRENSIMDRGTVSVTTDNSGYYWMESAYPITQWLVEEAYADGFQTTGITYQTDNQPNETTILGAGVDVNVHPVIGLGGRMDWGVKAYAPGTNGGIVGTVSYDTTRNELNPQYAAIEDWQPSISNMNVDLYAPVDCVIDPNTGEPDPNVTQVCDPTFAFQLAADGAYKTGNLLNQYVSETWERPTGCIARNVDGNPLVHGTDEQVLPLDPNAPCLEAPMMSVQFGDNFGATVDGNYGFADACEAGVKVNGTGNVVWGADGQPECSDNADHVALPSNSDYLVKVEVPKDAFNRPLYQVTREEDINIANGDSFVPQVPPPDCAGALHTVDVQGILPDGPNAVVNPTFVDIGGSIYEGQQKPLCDTKLVHLSDRKSIAPGFNFFTDVPLPGRFWGLTVDDLNFSSNPKSQAYGEKQPVSFNPVGIYDYTNRLIYTVESDYNGLWDVLLPSTNRISCPTPSGVCANLYRFVGNDPGTPGHWNPNYDPQYRTIAAEFEAFPGLTLPADLAPTPVSVAVQIPGSQTISSIACALNDTTGATPATNPEFFAISKPWMRVSDSGAARQFTITGLGFGTVQGSVKLDTFTMTINSWSDRQIVFRVPSEDPNQPNTGPHQLKITTAGNKSTVNALTFHVLNNANSNPNANGIYNPSIFEVGVGKTYDPATRTLGGYEHALQDAINDAANVSSGKALVVVYPGLVDNTNPRYNGRGAYYENIVMHSPIKLQGVGPGGVYPNGTPVQGSILDGIGFGGDSAMADGWRTLVGGLTWPGNQDVSEGEVIYVLPNSINQFGSTTYKAAIDGLDIRGGDQQGFPGNLNAIFGGFPGPAGGPNVETQGGAIFANAYANNLQITNNIIQNNGGTYGTIRIGTPNIDATTLNHNQNVRIANNRIIANGGTNLAGAIGLFGGSDNYEVASNDLCGNFSAEYGGAISHFGRSNNGSIHDNRVYFNHSYDEGAGIMIAGELATNPTANYGQPGGPQGSGPVTIYNNLIQGNMSEDDGGGLRFLMAGNFPMNVYNNMIVSNIATHEGGGVAIDDAPNMRFNSNTVMNNKTTATAITSDGQPAPAGLSTGQNSAQLRAILPGQPQFSPPLLFNDIFWENWAGTKGINTVTGITQADHNRWDMGALGTSFQLSPTNSVLQSETVPHNDVVADPSNRVDQNPLVNATLDIPVSFSSWRTNINFIGAIMVTADLPPQLLSDYHLSGTTSSAFNLGASAKSSVNAPTFDIDNQGRPALGGYDAGADEFPGAQVDLSITKTDGQTSAVRGSTFNYTIVVTNNSPAVVVGLAPVTDNFPAVLTNVTWACTASSLSSCGAANGSGNINTTVTLQPGGTATFVATVTLPANAAGNSLSNTATVATPAGTSDPTPGNNSATDTDSVVNPQANLAITKTDGQASAIRGSTFQYTIVASNAGPSVANGATVADTFSNRLTGVTWTCTATAGSTCPASGSGNINAAVNLAVNGAATFIATVSLPANASSTPLFNLATVAPPAGIADPALLNNIAADLDTVINPPADLSITKTDGQTTAARGSAVTYTIVVANAGPSAVSGASVNDTVSNKLTGVTWTCAASIGSSCTTTSGNGSISNRLVNLPNGGSATFTVHGTVTATAASPLANTATVTAPAATPDLVTNNNSATDTDTIVAAGGALLFATPLLDSFALQSGSVSSSWRGQTSSFAVQNSQIAVGGSGYMYWKKDFQANQEARLTFTTIAQAASVQGLLLKVKDLKNDLLDAKSSAIQVFYNATTSSVVVQTMAKGQGTIVRAEFGGVSFASGDILSAQALTNGTVNVLKNGTLVGTTNVTVGANPWPSKLAAKGGSIGVAFNTGAAAFDDFGGGNLP